MAGEFRAFNAKYRHLKATRFEYECLSDEDMRAAAMNVRHWPFTVGKYSHEYIEHAVYTSATADKWQQFRVSLQGWTTAAKLLRLLRRRSMIEAQIDPEEQKREHCRIDNYIMALRRAGLLSEDMHIVYGASVDETSVTTAAGI